MASSNLSAAEFVRARRALAAELAVLLAVSVALFHVAPRIDEAALHTRILYTLLLALFSATLLHGVLSALALLDWDCPRCRGNYCGSLLFRSRCRSCGHAAAGREAHQGAARER